ncbi:MAG: hypothetical protein JXQ65_08760 [Candidatus Marinimicrobia bacterium]|nr:hypothetical protein [Candidatus Neomarinimicrobiota bacterium]
MNKHLGLIIAILMLLALLNNSYFFMGILKLNMPKWLAFNACSLSIIIYLLCFFIYQITKMEYFLAIPLLPLYYYGTMGLFIMPWNASNIPAHITHFLITVNVLWIIYTQLKDHNFASLGKGLLIGMIIFVPIFAIIQSYTQLHKKEFMTLLQNL